MVHYDQGDMDDNAVGTTSTGKEIAVRQQQEVKQLTDVFGSLNMAAAHNFIGDVRETWEFTAKVCGPDVKRFDQLDGKPITIRHWYAHRVELADPKSGEITPAIRVVLVQPDGLAVAFVSDGIARDLARMIQAFGVKPWEPPIAVRVAPVRTRSGYKTLTLIPA